MSDPVIPVTVAYGDEIVSNSVSVIVGHATLLTVSRDGSRRAVRAETVEIINLIKYPQLGNRPHSTTDPFQEWAGMVVLALALPIKAGQKVLLWNGGVHHKDVPKGRAMVGLYVPYGVSVVMTELSAAPVNPIPRCMELREQIATIAHGWDSAWHGRYVFGNHLRQQVVSRIIDGMLVDAEAKVAALLASATPAVNDDWKAALALVETEVKALCDLCAGDPALWARRLARNIDVEAFRGRLALGEVPKPVTSTMPWTPGAPVTKLIIPSTITNINERYELAARWHDDNRRAVENVALRYYDEDMQAVPEKTYGYDSSHEHDPAS